MDFFTTMPHASCWLIFIRHSEDVWGAVEARARAGDESGYTPKLVNTPRFKHGLTAHGRLQAKLVRKWIVLRRIGRANAHIVICPCKNRRILIIQASARITL